MAGRAGRAILATLVVVAILAVGADVAARLIVQSTLADRLQEELSLPRPPDVSLHGIPFLYHLARQRFPAATIRTRDLNPGGLRMRTVTLEVEDLRLAPQGGVVRAGRGTGEIEVTDGALTDYLQQQGTDLTVTFLGPRARVATSLAEREVSATGKLRLRDGALRFRPGNVEPGGVGIPAGALSFDIAVPQLLDGVSYDHLTVEEGVAVLTATLDAAALRVRL